jgi:hypothetical protein
MFDKRRRLMAQWADYVTTPVAVAGKVVAIRAEGPGHAGAHHRGAQILAASPAQAN